METVWMTKFKEILRSQKSPEEKLKEFYNYGVQQEWELMMRWQE